MLTDALNYPRESSDVVLTVLVGGLLTFFSFLLIPWFLVLGYLLRVLDRTADGNDDPPRFDEWGDMLVEGLKAFIITFVYGLLPLVLIIFFVIGGVMGAALGDTFAALGFLWILLGLLFTFVVTIGIAYFVPAALANFVETGNIGAAFDFGTIKEVTFTETYLIGWLTAAVILIGASILGGMLSVIPFIGWVLGALIIFYAYVSATYIIGHIWGDLARATTATTQVD